MKRRFKKFALIIPFIFLAAAGIFLLTRSDTQAAPVVGFQPGNIMSDAVFTKHNSMTVAQIQNFLNAKGANCTSGSNCLKNYTQGGKSAARIIYDVAQQYKINPQVFIVLLQKEVGLVTMNNPESWRYRTATGYGCPDSTPGVCDSRYYGFANQLRQSGTMFRAIMNNSPTWYTPYVVGWNNILYHPHNNCGTMRVNIQNRTTAALYSYTPYVPNQAALNAGYGTGDNCSSYGNRNFYQYFKDWFGNPHTGANNSYIATFHSQSAYPTLQPGSSTYLSIMYKNTGTETWYDDRAVNAGIAPAGVGPTRLGTYNPGNRSSVFGHLWGSGRNRPSINFANVYESNGTTLAADQRIAKPGQIVRFGFVSTVPEGHSPNTFREDFRPVVETQGYMQGSTVFINYKIAADYQYSVVTPPSDITLPKGGRGWVYASYKNTGKTFWYDDNAVKSGGAPRGTKPMRLGTADPHNRRSPFGKLWTATANRPSVGFNTVYEADGVTKAASQRVVRTGQIVRFGFIANVPTTLKAGTYTETIQPVANGWGYIPGQSLSYKVTVLEDYQQKWAGQSAYPTIKRGGTASGYIEYTNTGTKTWYDDYAVNNKIAPSGTKPTRLSTANPTGRVSSLGKLWTAKGNRPSINFAKVYDSNGNEITNTRDKHIVKPGQTVRFGFIMTASTNAPLGTHNEWFIPHVEGVRDIGGSGVFLRVTIVP